MPAGYNKPSSSSAHRRSDRHQERQHHHHNTTTRKPSSTTTTTTTATTTSSQRYQNPRKPCPPTTATSTTTHRVTKLKPKPRSNRNSQRDVAHVAEPYSSSRGYSYRNTQGRDRRPNRSSASATTTTTTFETGSKARSGGYGLGAGSGPGFDASYRSDNKRHSSPYIYTTSGGSHGREHRRAQPRPSSTSDDREEDRDYPHDSDRHRNRRPNNAVKVMSDVEESQMLDSDEEGHSSNGSANENDKALLRQRKRSRALKAALTAGAVEAFRQRKRPGEWVGQKGVRVATAALSAGLIDIGLESRQQTAMENGNNDSSGDGNGDQEEQGTAEGSRRSDVLAASSRLVSSALGGILIDKVANGGLV